MKKSSLIFGILCGALLASAIFASLGGLKSGATADGAGQERKVKIAHSLPTDHPVHLGIERFSERLNALSGGKITCSIYPNGQLGSETEYLEKMQTGSLDIAKTSAAPVASFVPRMKVFSTPYLFRDSEHYWDVLNGELGRELLEKLSDRGEGKSSGFRGLCYFDAGSRNFYSVEPIKTPADLKGKAIRVMQDPVAIKMMQTFEATPNPMAGGEIYGALQRGNINGAENNPPTFVAQAHFEVCKHFTFDHHSRIPDILQISSQLWDSLSDQEKEWFTTAADDASRFQRKLWEEKTQKAITFMKEKGVTIYKPNVSDFEAAISDAFKTSGDSEVDEIKEKIKQL